MMERIESRPLLFERESQVSQTTKIMRIIMTGRQHAKIVSFIIYICVRSGMLLEQT